MKVFWPRADFIWPICGSDTPTYFFWSLNDFCPLSLAEALQVEPRELWHYLTFYWCSPKKRQAKSSVMAKWNHSKRGIEKINTWSRSITIYSWEWLIGWLKRGKGLLDEVMTGHNFNTPLKVEVTDSFHCYRVEVFPVQRVFSNCGKTTRPQIIASLVYYLMCQICSSSTI